MKTGFKVSKSLSIETEYGKDINIIPVNDDPNDNISSTKGSLAINISNGDIFCNINDEKEWQKITNHLSWIANEW